jgi:hypothetical protein
LSSGYSSLDELLAHHFARSEETILDRAKRKTRDLCYLVVAHVVRVAKLHEFPVGYGKLADDLFNLRAPFCSLALLFGREPATL